jgi:hypothetical protein
MRGFCKQALGDHQGAEKDRARLEALENRDNRDTENFFVIK